MEIKLRGDLENNFTPLILVSL